MASVVWKPDLGVVRRFSWTEEIKAAEWIAVSFFAYLAGLALVRPFPLPQRALLAVAPFLIWMLCRLESRASRPWSRVTRDWTALGLILTAYWTLGWFATSPLVEWQNTWLSWDRTLLDQMRLRQVIEASGSFVPSLLENVYLLLYTIPAASLGVLYYFGKRPQVNRYLAVLLLGTFVAYAILPLVPVASPRVAFPGQDLPNYEGGARSLNTWLLDHLDISTGVFPSGHCAVAFSSAFGLLAALRRRWITTTAFLLALIVYAATIYGRYHYAADGLASIFISVLAWRFVEWSASHD